MRQITAPAYMQNVLKVVIRVVAPEKSIDPCACAAVENAMKIRLGVNARTTFRTRSFVNCAAVEQASLMRSCFKVFISFARFVVVIANHFL
jgi:hypothetical protein